MISLAKWENGPPLLFQSLSTAEVDIVRSKGVRRVVYRDAHLFTQGSVHDGIFIVETGRIRVYYVSPRGREITLAYWHPGNIVGGPDVFKQGVHIWSGIATANSSVLHLPGDVVKALALSIPQFAIGLIEELSSKGKSYSALVQMLGTRSPTDRFALLLLHLLELYGIEEGDSVAIGVPFTHAELASMLGVTRQWITNSVKQFTAAGILDVSRGLLVVKRRHVLTDLGEGRPTDLVPSE